jgi:hypothetical protein
MLPRDYVLSHSKPVGGHCGWKDRHTMVVHRQEKGMELAHAGSRWTAGVQEQKETAVLEGYESKRQADDNPNLPA